MSFKKTFVVAIERILYTRNSNIRELVNQRFDFERLKRVNSSPCTVVSKELFKEILDLNHHVICITV